MPPALPHGGAGFRGAMSKSFQRVESLLDQATEALGACAPDGVVAAAVIFKTKSGNYAVYTTQNMRAKDIRGAAGAL